MHTHTTIEKYSHFFVVKDPTPDIIKAIYSLSGQYTQFGLVVDPVTKRKRWAPTKTFAVYVDGGKEFRLHINQFPELMELLRNAYVRPDTYTIVEKSLYEGTEVELKVREGWQLYDQQEEASSFILDNRSRGLKSPLLSMPTGSGKAQPLSSKLRIPGGWVSMGMAYVGMTVTTWDGKPSMITGVYPQGVRPTLKLIFADGRQARCDGNHLWKVYSAPEATRGQVIEAAEIARRLQQGETFFIDLCLSEEGGVDSTALDLYFLGQRVAIENRAGFSLIAESDHAGRLAFMQGVLDHGGHYCKKTKTITYLADGVELALDIEYLAHSLGAIASITPLEDKYAVEILHPLPGTLFRQAHRHVRFPANPLSLKLRILSVQSDGEEEMQCISIDHPDQLYVTNDFIVTHNTVTALVTTARIQQRFAVVVLAGYVDKWIGDIQECLEIDESEIGVISGGKDRRGKNRNGGDLLVRSTLYPGSNLPIPKAFVISLNTITRWYGMYEENRKHPALEEYDCMPWDFWRHLGIGTVIFDEIHQHFHAVYRTHTYLHVPQTINLSATLISKDPTIRRVHGMMFPQEKRFEKIKMKRYITTWACVYQIHDFNQSKLQTTDYGSTTYSQNAFEMSILRHKTIRPQYLNMLLDLIKKAYLDRYHKGDKLIIFVGRSMMAHKLVEEIKKKWPAFDTRTFLEGDPPENMHEPDIRVTTVISGSTAHDIANLRVAIMTNSIDSPVANLQAFGRLREMKHRTEHNDVHFYWVYCSMIPKQQDYHHNRTALLADRTLAQKQLYLGTLYP